MVYFPAPVFKNIMSFVRTPHPMFHAWRDQSSIFTKIYKERLTTLPYSKKLLPFIFRREVRGYGHNSLTGKYNFDLDWNIKRKTGYVGIHPNAHLSHANSIKDLKAYLKQNKIKGYSGKKKVELIRMCMSF